MYKEWTFGETKAVSKFYYQEPFKPFDEIYGNKKRTSFLLLNTRYFEEGRIGRMSVQSDIDYSNYNPQQYGCIMEAYANGVIPEDIYNGCLLAYAGSLHGEPANEFRNLRYLGGVDYLRLMQMLSNNSPEVRAELKQIIYRDIFYVHNIMARYVAETRLENKELKLKVIKELGEWFNRTASLRLDFKPVVLPELSASSIIDSICKHENANFEDVFMRLYNETIKRRDEKVFTDPIAFRSQFKFFKTKIPYYGIRDIDNNIFANFKPSAQYGNQIASLPENKRDFGVEHCAIAGLKLMSLTETWDAPVMDVLFAPEIVFTNPEGHTLSTISEQLSSFVAYTQRAMGYRFLNTLRFFKEKGQIEEPTFKATELIVYTHLFGNQSNLLFNYKSFLDILLANDYKDLRSNLYNIMMAEKANLNWIYADKCENLQDKLPEARDLVKRCYCSQYRPNDHLDFVGNKIPEQYNYVFDRLYTDHTRRDLSTPIQDGGKYEYYKKSIEQDIGDIPHYYYEIEDKSRF